jgi:hypothetical protein
MRAHGTSPLITPWWIPLIIPLLPEEPSPVPESLLLTWNPFFACGAIPVHSGPRLLVNWPLPPSSFPPHPHFPPQWFPNPNMCPPKTTSRPRLHIVGYSYPLPTISRKLLAVTVSSPSPISLIDWSLGKYFYGCVNSKNFLSSFVPPFPFVYDNVLI